MLSRRGKTVIHRRWNEDLDDRRFRPAMNFGVCKRAVHIVERRRKNDARAVMLSPLLARQACEVRKFRQRHIHAHRT